MTDGRKNWPRRRNNLHAKWVVGATCTCPNFSPTLATRKSSRRAFNYSLVLQFFCDDKKCWENFLGEFKRTILCLCAFVFAFLINLPSNVYTLPWRLRQSGRENWWSAATSKGLSASFIKDELIRKFDNKIGRCGAREDDRKHLRREKKILIRKSAAIEGGDGGLAKERLRKKEMKNKLKKLEIPPATR